MTLTVTSSLVNYLKAMMELNPSYLPLRLALPANNILRRNVSEVMNTLAHYVKS